MQRHVLVVGAGVIGAAVAYHLARHNIKTTVLDQREPAHGVTAHAFSWINVVNGINDALTPLRLQAIEEFDRLEFETGGRIRLRRCGALVWRDSDTETEKLAEYSRQVDYPVTLLTRSAIGKMEPALASPPAVAVFAKKEAAVNPVTLTRQYLALAGTHGARVLADHAVTSILVRNRIAHGVATSRGTFEADTIVVASGTGTAPLLGKAGIHLPVIGSPSILIDFATRQSHINMILSGPEFEIRQPSPARLLGAEGYIAESGENGPRAVAERALASVRRGIRGGDSISIARVTVGVRPIPKDGKPLIGFLSDVENLYVATMHSAITWSALAGRLCADEIALGDRPADFEQFHPDRLTRMT